MRFSPRFAIFKWLKGILNLTIETNETPDKTNLFSSKKETRYNMGEVILPDQQYENPHTNEFNKSKHSKRKTISETFIDNNCI